MTTQMKDSITGYIASAGLGVVFTSPMWEKAWLGFVVGGAGALGGLLIKLIWNTIRNEIRKRKGNDTEGNRKEGS